MRKSRYNHKHKNLHIILFSVFPIPSYEICKRIIQYSSYIYITLILPHYSKYILQQFLAQYSKQENSRLRILYIKPRDILLSLKIFKLILRFRPQIVHLFTGGGKVGYLILPLIIIYSLISPIINQPMTIVSTILEPYKRKGISLINYIESLLEMKLSRKIIVTASYMRRILEEYKICKGKEIYVVPDGEWDAPLFKRWEPVSVKEEPWVLFFGTVSEYKGLKYLIQAEPIVSKHIPNLKIVIAGSGAKTCQKYIVNKEKYILIDKFIDYKEGALLFKKCKVVVLPYIDGTTSGIVPTAYIFKKPVIATRLPGFIEQIDDGKTGILVPPRDPKALAKAIILLLTNEKLRKRMGENGFNKLKRELSYESISNKIYQIYIDS